MVLSALKNNEIHKLTTLQPKGWPTIIPHFEFYTVTDFSFPIKMVINNEIVGIGTSIIHHKCAWLAHIIVHPKFRNKGIGKAITKQLIAEAHEKNCETISLIATELGSYVYEKLGFKTETTYLFYKLSENEEKYIPSKSVVSYTSEMEQQVLDFDKKISGESRDQNISLHLKNAFVFLRNKNIEGLFIPSLGEGSIIASTSEAGLELLKLRLNTHKNVIFPIENSIATEYMSLNNHEIVYKAKRMRLGNSIPVQLHNIYARIGGNLG